MGKHLMLLKKTTLICWTVAFSLKMCLKSTLNRRMTSGLDISKDQHLMNILTTTTVNQVATHAANATTFFRGFFAFSLVHYLEHELQRSRHDALVWGNVGQNYCS